MCNLNILKKKLGIIPVGMALELEFKATEINRISARKLPSRRRWAVTSFSSWLNQPGLAKRQTEKQPSEL